MHIKGAETNANLFLSNVRGFFFECVQYFTTSKAQRRQQNTFFVNILMKGRSLCLYRLLAVLLMAANSTCTSLDITKPEYSGHIIISEGYTTHTHSH